MLIYAGSTPVYVLSEISFHLDHSISGNNFPGGARAK